MINNTNKRQKRAKLFLFLVATIMISSCTKDNNDAATDTGGETSYTFQSKVPLMTMAGSTPEVSYCTLYECDQEGSKIKNNTIKPIESGKEYTFTADPHASKVKVYYCYKPMYSTYGGSTIGWVQQVFYLEKGKNVKIITTGESVIGSNEP